MSYQLIEYETGMKIRCASNEDRKEFESAQKRGNPYFIVGYHGYVLKAVVKKDE